MLWLSVKWTRRPTAEATLSECSSEYGHFDCLPIIVVKVQTSRVTVILMEM